MDEMNNTGEAPEINAGPEANPNPAAPSPTPASDGLGAGAAPKVTPAVAPVAPAPGKHSIIGKIYDTVLDALGGKNDVTYTRDEKTGKQVAHATPRSHGDQWNHIIAGALTGLAAGGKMQGPARRNPVAAFSVGAGAGMEQSQKQDKDARDASDQELDQRRRTAMFNANMAKLNQEIAGNAFNMADKQYELGKKIGDDHREYMDKITKGDPGNRYLGVAHSPEEMREMATQGENLIRAHANGQIITLPHVNDQGKVDGTEFAFVTPEWGERMVTEPTQLTLHQVDKNGNLIEKPMTIQPGTYRNKDLQAFRQADDKLVSDYGVKKMEKNAALEQEKLRQAAETTRERERVAGETERERIKAAAQSGKAETVSVYAFDPKENRIVQTNQADAVKRGLTGIEKVNAPQIEKDRASHRVLNDIQLKMNRLYESKDALDQRPVQTQMISQMITEANNELSVGAHNSLLGVALPTGGITNWLEKHWVSQDLSQKSRAYITAYAQAKEAVMGYGKVLTGGVARNESQIRALINTIPGVEPDSKMAAQKLEAFQENLDTLRKGIPKLEGMEEQESTLRKERNQKKVPPAAHIPGLAAPSTDFNWDNYQVAGGEQPQ